jgi:hypothetical protein
MYSGKIAVPPGGGGIVNNLIIKNNSNLRYKSGRLQVLPDVYRNVFYFILEVSCAS